MALWLPIPGQVSPSQERMHVALEELQDLKGVWSELSKIWAQVDELKEKPWLSVAPRKVTFVSYHGAEQERMSYLKL